MPTDQCSSIALDEIKKDGSLGARQRRVLSIFMERPGSGFTATEIVGILGRGASENTRNRITELVQKGLLRKIGKSRCSRTNRMVNVFQWTGRTNPMSYKYEFVTCTHCNGKGGKLKKVYFAESPAQKELFDGNLTT